MQVTAVSAVSMSDIQLSQQHGLIALCSIKLSECFSYCIEKCDGPLVNLTILSPQRLTVAPWRQCSDRGAVIYSSLVIGAIMSRIPCPPNLGISLANSPSVQQ